MAKAGGSLRPDLQRMWVKLDAAPDGAVIIDKHGAAWQKSALIGDWYRAFDGDGISAFHLAQNADGATFLTGPESQEVRSDDA